MNRTKYFMFWLFAIILSFGFTMIGCDDGSGNNDEDTESVKTAAAAAVTAVSNTGDVAAWKDALENIPGVTVPSGFSESVASGGLITARAGIRAKLKTIANAEGSDAVTAAVKALNDYLAEYWTKGTGGGAGTETGTGNPENGDIKEDETDNNGPAITGLTFMQVNNPFHQGNGTIYSSINDITYGNGKFVVVGIAGQIACSTDGSIWTMAKNNGFRLNDTSIYGVTYGGGKFVAFGSRGNVVSHGRITTWRDIVYSSDGIYWIRADTTNFNEAISGITYGGGKFVAVTNSGKIGYSSNGSIWLPVTDSILNGAFFSSVAYGAGMFIAVSRSGKTAYSSDGINWTVLISGTFSRITYINDRFIAWGNGITASSSDGLTWIPLVNITLNGIVYGAGKLVLWGANTSYSIDGGTTWLKVDSTLTDGIRNITYGNGRFIAAGGDLPGQIACSNKQE